MEHRSDPLLELAISPYFERYSVLPHATLVLSPPTLTFSLVSNGVGVSLSCASPAGSTQGPSWPRVHRVHRLGHVSIVSIHVSILVCGQSNSTLVVLFPPLLAAALFNCKAPHYRFLLLPWLLLMNTCNFCFSPLVSRLVSEPYKSTAFTQRFSTWSRLLVP